MIDLLCMLIEYWMYKGPCRALLVDVAPKSQQNIGGSLFSLMLGDPLEYPLLLLIKFINIIKGIGNLSGYFVGSLQLVDYLPFLKTDIRALFTLAMFVLLGML
jgi:hypothetical protein